MTQKQTVFISHKLSDNLLALAVKDFILNISGNSVTIFCASDDDAQRPRFGSPIGQQLKEALAATSLVILLYTDPSENWEWCMWECGVATDPQDDSETRVVVFSFGGEAPDQYKSQLNLELDLSQIEQTYTRLAQFINDFCEKDDFWPEENRFEFSPSASQITMFSKDFVGKLETIGVGQINKSRQKLMEIASEMSPELASKLVPLVENAEKALKWGIVDPPKKVLFDQLWGSYEDDFKSMADHTLVFRPPGLSGNWDSLLSIVVDSLDENKPEDSVIKLVSGEENPLRIWKHAMAFESSDIRDYEEPLRTAAKKLHTKYGVSLVDRRFLFDSNYFKDNSDHIERFSAVVSWMTEAHISVSVSKSSYANDQKWKDFAVLSNLAVSRFDTFSDKNRVLKQTFSNTEIASALRAWKDTLKPIWSSSDEMTFKEFIEHEKGFI